MRDSSDLRSKYMQTPSNWLKMAIYFNDAIGASIANIFLFQTNDNDSKNLCYRVYFSKLCRLKIVKFCYQLYDWL